GAVGASLLRLPRPAHAALRTDHGLSGGHLAAPATGRGEGRGDAAGEPEALCRHQPGGAGQATVPGLLRATRRRAGGADRGVEERVVGGSVVLQWVLRERLQDAGGGDGVCTGGAVPAGVRRRGGGGKRGHRDSAKSAVEGAGGGDQEGGGGASESAGRLGSSASLGAE